MTSNLRRADTIEWVPFRNDSGEEIPPYACLRIAGMKVLSGNRLVLLAEKPDTYGSQHTHYINSHLAVPVGNFGGCAVPTSPVSIAASSTASPTDGNDPTINESWGPVDGSWELERYVGGFVAVGLIDDGVGLFVQAPMLLVHGKTDESIDIGASGTVSIVDGRGETEYNLEEVANRYADVEADKRVQCVYRDERWFLDAAEC